MIPNFTEKYTTDGFKILPKGIWETTLQEIEEKLLFSERRIELFNGLKKALIDLKEIGCKIVFIDGSFVTSKLLDIHSDIDVCYDHLGINWELLNIKHPIFLNPDTSLQKHKYGCECFPAYTIERNSQSLFIDFFQQVREKDYKKGILKITL